MNEDQHRETTSPLDDALRPPVFPFSALIGQSAMREALLVTLVHPGLSGVLVRGERGTAKSTAVRALAGLLPEQGVVAGCPYGCDPEHPQAACPSCAERLRAGPPPARGRRPMPFVNLPVGSTEDRVLGSVDLERALRDGVQHFQPGLLGEANRGILYIDEVNLLPDHLMDLLLDAAASGVNVVEREGVRCVHPSRFLLVGTMNPEEGDLRPQLTDRFDLSVEVRASESVDERVAVLERRLAFEQDPTGFIATWREDEEEIGRRVARARALLPGIALPGWLLADAAALSLELGVDGHRSEIAAVKAACGLTALDGRDTVTAADLAAAVVLAYPHRLRRRPFDEGTERGPELVGAVLERLKQRSPQEGPAPSEDPAAEKKSPPIDHGR